MRTRKSWQAIVAVTVSFAPVILSITWLGAGDEVAPGRFPAAGQLPAADHFAGEAPLQTAVQPPSRPSASPVGLVKSTVVNEACSRALEVVNRAGLELPRDTAFHCPGNTETKPGDRQHSGVACFDHKRYCPQDSYIAVNPDQIHRGDEGMQYVIAHEICHIDSYVASGHPGMEEAADACAAAAGFPR